MTTDCLTTSQAVRSVAEMNAHKIILARLKELGWSNYRLAEACRARDVNVTTVYEFLKGKRTVTLPAFEAMADALGLELKARDARDFPHIRANLDKMRERPAPAAVKRRRKIIKAI